MIDRLLVFALCGLVVLTVTGCAGPGTTPATRASSATEPSAAPAPETTVTAVAGQGLRIKMEYPTGPLRASQSYSALIFVTNTATTAVTLTGHNGAIFNLTATDATGSGVYDWNTATGRRRKRGTFSLHRLAPGSSVSERREFMLPQAGTYTLAVDFIAGGNQQPAGHALRAGVEVR
jgi:hypothetical protein